MWIYEYVPLTYQAGDATDLLHYEMPIKENASRLARRQTPFCQSLEHHKISWLHLPWLIFSHKYIYVLLLSNT